MEKLFQDFYFFKIKGVYQKVAAADIVYLKSEGDYVLIQRTNDRKLLYRGSLGKSEKEMDRGNFLRIHRSYLINVHFIEQINFQEGVVSVDGHCVPMSRIGSKTLSEAINKL